MQSSLEKFRELFHNANDAIYLWEVKSDGSVGRCLEVNNVACRMLGFSRAELLSFTPRNLSDEDSAPKIPGIVKELTAQGHKTFEMTHVGKDGRKVPVGINAHIFTLNEKKVVVSIARDITDRRRAQEALQESQQRFRTAFLTSPDAININRIEDGMYIDINHGFTALTGYTRDEVIGKTALELFRTNPGYFDLVITDMTMPHLTGDRLAIELLRLRPDLPIILCTGFSHKITEEKAKAMGIKAFIMKPIIMANLANSVRQALDAD
jgi:PAS domain S-box-containing protein